VAATLLLLGRRGWRVLNADLTLLAQAPKIAPWRDDMRASVAALLGVPAMQVNIKATTPEFLGAIGRSEGLAAMATVLLESAPPAK
jgi:2-C-methyl-D-erythritol 2,4-cyclodiphosphate synthase